MNEIGDAFAAALRRELAKPGATVAGLARQLGVTRQAFHAYLNGSLPRRARLHKAVHMWDLKLDLEKYSFAKGAFGSAEPKKSESRGVQRTLWEALDCVKDKDLKVSMKRTGKVLRVDVRIEIPA